MHPVLTVTLILLGLLFILMAVVVARTVAFVPKPQKKQEVRPVSVNSDKAVENLAKMIRCKTVSYREKELEDEAEFLRFEALLFELYPNVCEKAEFERVNDRALLFRIPGKTGNSPTVLMAHYDVVAVNEESWQKPPFGGIVEDGVLWGRGTLDTKGSLLGIMEAADALLSEGFTPERDIYLAFGGDEEINGGGAPAIVDLFRKRGITPGLVLDEGGAVVTSGEQVCLGGNDRYMAMCHKCWRERITRESKSNK